MQYIPGWIPLFINFLKEVKVLYICSENEIIKNFYIEEIKEKYGFLRVNVNSKIAEVHELAEQVEDDSINTCMECGKYIGDESEPQKNRGNWIYTLCESCITKEK